MATEPIDLKRQLEDLAKTSGGFTPTQAATVFVEDGAGWHGYELWIGDGHYDVDYDVAAHVVERGEIAGLRYFRAAPHPAREAFPLLRRLAMDALGSGEWTARSIKVLSDLYPAVKENKDGCFLLSDEQKTILGILALDVVGERLKSIA